MENNTGKSEIPALFEGENDASAGYLVAAVRTAGDALPLIGAYVTVTAVDGDGNSRVFGARVTGEGGRTTRITLPTPPLANSLSPGAGKPYALYNVDTDMPGYYPVFNIGVPVFPGTESVQNVRMMPVSGGNPPGENAAGGIYFDSDRVPNLGGAGNNTEVTG